MRKILIQIFTVIFFLTSSVVYSSDLLDGLNAAKKGDYKTALFLLRPLAKKGNVDAQFVLGGMNYEGSGIIKNYKVAMKWFKLAAQQGDVSSQLNLGLMYAKGQGVVQNYVYAHMWSNIAASSGHENGKKLRSMISKWMTPNDISTAQKLARECVEKKYKGC